MTFFFEIFFCRVNRHLKILLKQGEPEYLNLDLLQMRKILSVRSFTYRLFLPPVVLQTMHLQTAIISSISWNVTIKGENQHSA